MRRNLLQCVFSFVPVVALAATCPPPIATPDLTITISANRIGDPIKYIAEEYGSGLWGVEDVDGSGDEPWPGAGHTSRVWRQDLGLNATRIQLTADVINVEELCGVPQCFPGGACLDSQWSGSEPGLQCGGTCVSKLDELFKRSYFCEALGSPDIVGNSAWRRIDEALKAGITPMVNLVRGYGPGCNPVPAWFPPAADFATCAGNTGKNRYTNWVLAIARYLECTWPGAGFVIEVENEPRVYGDPAYRYTNPFTYGLMLRQARCGLTKGKIIGPPVGTCPADPSPFPALTPWTIVAPADIPCLREGCRWCGTPPPVGLGCNNANCGPEDYCTEPEWMDVLMDVNNAGTPGCGQVTSCDRAFKPLWDIFSYHDNSGGSNNGIGDCIATGLQNHMNAFPGGGKKLANSEWGADWNSNVLSSDHVRSRNIIGSAATLANLGHEGMFVFSLFEFVDEQAQGTPFGHGLITTNKDDVDPKYMYSNENIDARRGYYAYRMASRGVKKVNENEGIYLFDTANRTNVTWHIPPQRVVSVVKRDATAVGGCAYARTILTVLNDSTSPFNANITFAGLAPSPLQLRVRHLLADEVDNTEDDEDRELDYSCEGLCRPTFSYTLAGKSATQFILDCPTSPPAPLNLTTFGCKCDICIQWQANPSFGPDVVAYNLYRDGDLCNPRNASPIPRTQTWFCDTANCPPTQQINHTYVVRAVTDQGFEGALSNTATYTGNCELDCQSPCIISPCLSCNNQQ